MVQAGRKALSRACGRGELSFSSVDTIADRWAHFAAYAKTQGIGRMERITPGLVQEYGRGLADQVTAGTMTPSYAQNMVSAVNTVLHQVREWHSISPTKDCGIGQRSQVRSTPPAGLDRTQLDRSLNVLRETGGERGAAVAELARELGLRTKEASLLNAKKALREAQSRGAVTILEGTKGGLTRSVPITRPEQLGALKRAAEVQGGHRALMPGDKNWKQWRAGGLRQVREVLQAHGIARLHDLRAAYACDRYQQETGTIAPVFGGKIKDKAADQAARGKIAEELGHGRVDVTSAYLGGRC